MKTKFINCILHKKTRHLLAILLCLNSLSGITQIAPSLSFKNPVLVSGTALQQGAVYKFPSVYPGIDAFITIQNLLNGASVTNIDQTGGVGYDDAFQPIVNSVSGSPNSLGRFLIQFKTTAGLNYSFPVLAATGLDIDGSTLSEVEFCTINMNGGSAYFQGNTPELSVTRSGTGYKALNISGNNFNGIDTANKSVMFTVRRSNLFSMTIDFGCVRSAGSGVRNYAVFFRDFIYPFQDVLPVTLIAFSVTQKENNAIDINWTTSEETNADHFAIERSFDGNQFNDVVKVPASGNSRSIINYSFTDRGIGNNKTLYYRLRMIDLDGKFKYSSICVTKIALRQESKFNIITYPNPVVNLLQVTIPAIWQDKQALIEVYTISGVMTCSKLMFKAGKTESVNVRALPSGTYLLILHCNNETVHQKFIKN